MVRDIVIFDTETTGLGPRSEVIQLSAIVVRQEDNNLRFKNVISFYADTNEFIPKEVVDIHGVDNKTLKTLSNGEFFEDQLSKHMDFIESDVPILYMAYNIKFDKRLINQTLQNNGYSPINFGRTISKMPTTQEDTCNVCLMNVAKSLYGYGRNIKLETIVSNHLNKEIIDTTYAKLKKKFNVKTFNGGFHDALYDSVSCLIMLLQTKAYLV